MFKFIFISFFVFFSSNAMSQSNSEYINESVEELRMQTAGHSASWHLGEEKNWAADLNAGQIKFTLPNGIIGKASMQVIGTYNKSDGTFLWGWDHPSVPLPIRKHAQLAFDWGKKNNEPSFTTPKVKCSEEEVWKFAAVVNHLAKSNGVYRGTSDKTHIFMTFDEVKLSQNQGGNAQANTPSADEPNMNTVQDTVDEPMTTIKDFTVRLFIELTKRDLIACKNQYPDIAKEVESIEVNYLKAASATIDELDKNRHDDFQIKVSPLLYPSLRELIDYKTEEPRMRLVGCNKLVNELRESTNDKISLHIKQFSDSLINSTREFNEVVSPK